MKNDTAAAAFGVKAADLIFRKRAKGGVKGVEAHLAESELARALACAYAAGARAAPARSFLLELVERHDRQADEDCPPEMEGDGHMTCGCWECERAGALIEKGQVTP